MTNLPTNAEFSPNIIPDIIPEIFSEADNVFQLNFEVPFSDTDSAKKLNEISFDSVKLELSEIRSKINELSGKVDELPVSTAEKTTKMTNKKKLLIGTLAVGAGALGFSQASDTIDALKENANWLAPSLITTELAWNVGAGMVIVSAGQKIGNILKIREKFKQSFTEARKTGLFKTGRYINLFGEVGTFSIASAGSVATLPPSAWPLSIGALTALAAPGATFQWAMFKSDKKDSLGGNN